MNYEEIMNNTASEASNLLQRQEKNQKVLKEAFKELGYVI